MKIRFLSFQISISFTPSSTSIDGSLISEFSGLFFFSILFLRQTIYPGKMKKPTIQTFLIQVQIRFFVDSWKKNVHHIHLCLLNVVPGINVLQRKKQTLWVSRSLEWSRTPSRFNGNVRLFFAPTKNSDGYGCENTNT